MSEAWLSQRLADVCEEIAAGKVNIEFGAGDVSNKALTDSLLNAERRRDLIYADLSVLNPDLYPTEVTQKVRITTSRFNDV